MLGRRLHVPMSLESVHLIGNDLLQFPIAGGATITESLDPFEAEEFGKGLSDRRLGHTCQLSNGGGCERSAGGLAGSGTSLCR